MSSTATATATAHRPSDLLTPDQAAEVAQVHPATIWRWAKDGYRLRTGERVRLATMRFGHGLRVRYRDLLAFGELIAEKVNGEDEDE